VRDILLAATRALDNGEPEEARNHLRSLPLVKGERGERLVAVGIWKRLLRSFGSSQTSPQLALPPLDRLGAAAANRAFMRDAYEAIPVLEKQFGPEDAAAIIASTIWDRVLKGDSDIFISVFELFFRAGGERCMPAFERFIAEQRDYVPIYWNFLLLTRSFLVQIHAEVAALTHRLLEKSGRTDLAPLFDLYLKQMRQVPVSEIMASALALKAPNQRWIVAHSIATMDYTLDELPIVVGSFADLVRDLPTAGALVVFMQARLAVAEERWHDAIKCAATARADPRFFLSRASDLLRALALARLKQVEDAAAVLDDVVVSADANPFQRARATFIRVTTELIARGLPFPEEDHRKTLPDPKGRPMAQSLWIGPRLRWIERLCIKSYLDRGWRFQLYVYDEPENVPGDCELLDASAIIPHHDVFFEGRGSGAHAGSVGAFSDLFRYRLLSMRGGLWTDTDVINFKKYDPDKRRFVCTEIADAGLAQVCGGIMAAPAGDELVVRAYERARAILAADREMVFTRVGPYLLAEVVLEIGVDKVEIMPPSFLGPISAMNAAFLFQPLDLVMAHRGFQDLVNIHIYTEMWRILGFAFDRPPSPQTFLGRLYADHLIEEDSTRSVVNK
jgi:hypothetical protein